MAKRQTTKNSRKKSARKKKKRPVNQLGSSAVLRRRLTADKAHARFAAAHKQGMSDLRNGNLKGVQVAIDKERAAIDEFREATEPQKNPRGR
jgi:hypothetical protein